MALNIAPNVYNIRPIGPITYICGAPMDDIDLRHLYERGQTLQSLMRLTGWSQGKVTRHLRAVGTTIRRGGLIVPPASDELRRLYESGQPLSALERLTGWSQSKLTRRLRAAGTTIRRQGHLVGLRHTAEVRHKISVATKGISKPPFSETWIANMKRARQGLKPSLGMRHTVDARRRMSETRRGPLNPRWIDGRKQIPYPSEWTHTLRRSIRQAHGGRCALCHVLPERPIHVHHIDADKQHCARTNLVPLCTPCHALAHRKGSFAEIKVRLGAIALERETAVAQ